MENMLTIWIWQSYVFIRNTNINGYYGDGNHSNSIKLDLDPIICDNINC
jgi:hypothetical protein